MNKKTYKFTLLAAALLSAFALSACGGNASAPNHGKGTSVSNPSHPHEDSYTIQNNDFLLGSDRNQTFKGTEAKVVKNTLSTLRDDSVSLGTDFITSALTLNHENTMIPGHGAQLGKEFTLSNNPDNNTPKFLEAVPESAQVTVIAPTYKGFSQGRQAPTAEERAADASTADSALTAKKETVDGLTINTGPTNEAIQNEKDFNPITDADGALGAFFSKYSQKVYEPSQPDNKEREDNPGLFDRHGSVKVHYLTDDYVTTATIEANKLGNNSETPLEGTTADFLPNVLANVDSIPSGVVAALTPVDNLGKASSKAIYEEYVRSEQINNPSSTLPSYQEFHEQNNYSYFNEFKFYEEKNLDVGKLANYKMQRYQHYLQDKDALLVLPGSNLKRHISIEQAVLKLHKDDYQPLLDRLIIATDISDSKYAGRCILQGDMGANYCLAAPNRFPSLASEALNNWASEHTNNKDSNRYSQPNATIDSFYDKSGATAYIAATAAMVKAQFPFFHYGDVKEVLFDTATPANTVLHTFADGYSESLTNADGTSKHNSTGYNTVTSGEIGIVNPLKALRGPAFFKTDKEYNLADSLSAQNKVYYFANDISGDGGVTFKDIDTSKFEKEPLASSSNSTLVLAGNNSYQGTTLVTDKAKVEVLGSNTSPFSVDKEGQLSGYGKVKGLAVTNGTVYSYPLTVEDSSASQELAEKGEAEATTKLYQDSLRVEGNYSSTPDSHLHVKVGRPLVVGGVADLQGELFVDDVAYAQKALVVLEDKDSKELLSVTDPENRELLGTLVVGKEIKNGISTLTLGNAFLENYGFITVKNQNDTQSLVGQFKYKKASEAVSAQERSGSITELRQANYLEAGAKVLDARLNHYTNSSDWTANPAAVERSSEAKALASMNKQQAKEYAYFLSGGVFKDTALFSQRQHDLLTLSANQDLLNNNHQGYSYFAEASGGSKHYVGSVGLAYSNDFFKGRIALFKGNGTITNELNKAEVANGLRFADENKVHNLGFTTNLAYRYQDVDFFAGFLYNSQDNDVMINLHRGKNVKNLSFSKYSSSNYRLNLGAAYSFSVGRNLANQAYASLGYNSYSASSQKVRDAYGTLEVNPSHHGSFFLLGDRFTINNIGELPLDLNLEAAYIYSNVNFSNDTIYKDKDGTTYTVESAKDSSSALLGKIDLGVKIANGVTLNLYLADYYLENNNKVSFGAKAKIDF